MVSFEIRFDDGEHFANASNLEEAREIRSINNFNYFSRSLHIYMKLWSKCFGCKLYHNSLEIKLV